MGSFLLPGFETMPMIATMNTAIMKIASQKLLLIGLLQIEFPEAGLRPVGRLLFGARALPLRCRSAVFATRALLLLSLVVSRMGSAR